MFGVVWSALQQSPGPDGFAVKGKCCFMCIVHSQGSLLSLTDWMQGGSVDLILIMIGQQPVLLNSGGL